jgi:hypothetical protein
MLIVVTLVGRNANRAAVDLADSVFGESVESGIRWLVFCWFIWQE